jgi:hypothetical protein
VQRAARCQRQEVTDLVDETETPVIGAVEFALKQSFRGQIRQPETAGTRFAQKGLIERVQQVGAFAVRIGPAVGYAVTKNRRQCAAMKNGGHPIVERRKFAECGDKESQLVSAVVGYQQIADRPIPFADNIAVA